MGTVDYPLMKMNFRVAGNLGRPNSVGNTWMGWTWLGDDNPASARYQKRYIHDWTTGVSRLNPIKHRQSMDHHWWCKNPKTVLQQARRSVFADGQAAWKLLTPTQQQEYHRRKYPEGMDGRNRFMREYLKSH